MNCKKRKNVIAIVILLALILVSFFMNFSYVSHLFKRDSNNSPAAVEIKGQIDNNIPHTTLSLMKKINNMKDELKILRLALDKDTVLKSQFLLHADRYCLASNKENESIKLQTEIAKLIKKCNLDLDSLGTPNFKFNKKNIGTGGFYIVTAGTIKNIVNFIHELEKIRPFVFWNNYKLSRDMTKDKHYIRFSGELLFVCVNDSKEITGIFNIKEK